MAKAECVSVLYLASVLLACTGLLVLGGGVWIVEGYQAVTEEADQIKDDLKNVGAEDIISTFEDYYSVLNKKGGWINVAYVMVAVGAVTFAVALLGFIGVHKETVFLLLTFIILLIIIIMLEIAAVLIIIRRDNEVKVFQQITKPENSFENIFQFREKFLFFVFTLSWSSTVLVMSVVVALVRGRAGGKEKLVELV